MLPRLTENKIKIQNTTNTPEAPPHYLVSHPSYYVHCKDTNHSNFYRHWFVLPVYELSIKGVFHIFSLCLTLFTQPSMIVMTIIASSLSYSIMLEFFTINIHNILFIHLTINEYLGFPFFFTL